MKTEKNTDFKKLFKQLSEPLTCGAFDKDGQRYQVYKGQRSSERIFVLSDQLHRHKPEVLFRTYFDDEASWIGAIKRYLNSGRAFLHPRLKLYCIQENMVTVRNLDFDLDIVSLNPTKDKRSQSKQKSF